MARFGSRKPFRRSRFSRPLARKKLVWATTSTSVIEAAGAASVVSLLTFAQWQVNTSVGDWETAKILRLVLDITAVPLATAESRLYALSVDDQQEGAHNPLLPASYGVFDPFHLGRLIVGGTTVNVPHMNSVSNQFTDNMRVFKVNRKIQADEELRLHVSPAAAAANQLTISFLARVLLQLD